MTTSEPAPLPLFAFLSASLLTAEDAQARRKAICAPGRPSHHPILSLRPALTAWLEELSCNLALPAEELGAHQCSYEDVALELPYRHRESVPDLAKTAHDHGVWLYDATAGLLLPPHPFTSGFAGTLTGPVIPSRYESLPASRPVIETLLSRVDNGDKNYLILERDDMTGGNYMQTARSADGWKLEYRETQNDEYQHYHVETLLGAEEVHQAFVAYARDGDESWRKLPFVVLDL